MTKISPPRVTIKVVSLVGSSRRHAMSSQFEDTSLQWSFQDAATALPDELKYIPEKARRIRGRYLEKGELGCFASHYLLWKGLIDDSNADAYIILEDDVVIDKGFFEKFVADAHEALDGINYLRFYSKVPSVHLNRKKFMDRFVVEYGELTFGTQAYYIDKHAAAKYLKSLTEVVRPIDDEMDRSWFHGVHNFCVFPHPVFEVQGPSTIASERRQLNPPTGVYRLGWLKERLHERFRKMRYRWRRRLEPTINRMPS